MLWIKGDETEVRLQGFLVGSVDRIVNMSWEEIMAPPKGADIGTYMTAVTQVDDVRDGTQTIHCSGGLPGL